MTTDAPRECTLARVRIMVIGASGLVGSHVLATMSRRGAAWGTALTRAVPPLRVLDVRDPAAVDSAIAELRPKIVVLAAAEPFVDLCEREPERTREVNVDGTVHVRESAERYGARLIFFSSDYVFDGRRGGYRECDPVAPLNEYGRQKVAAETAVRLAPSSLVIRTSGVFGRDERRKNFVCQVLDRLRGGMVVRAARDQVLSPTPAAPLAEIVGDLIEAGVEGTIHVAGSEPLSRAAFARRVASAFALDPDRVEAVSTAELGAIAPRPADSSLGIEALRATIGRVLPPLDDALAALRSEGL